MAGGLISEDEFKQAAQIHGISPAEYAADLTPANRLAELADAKAAVLITEDEYNEATAALQKQFNIATRKANNATSAMEEKSKANADADRRGQRRGPLPRRLPKGAGGGPFKKQKSESEEEEGGGEEEDEEEEEEEPAVVETFLKVSCHAHPSTL